MVKLKDYKVEVLYKDDKDIDKSFRIITEDLQEGEKISIVSDSMFKTVFLDSRRIQISAKLLSLIIDNPFEEILANLRFTKNDLDKDDNTKKGLKSDYVATLNNSIINIEMNNNGSLEILKRNTEYLNRLYASLLTVGSKYKYQQVLQININNFAVKGFDKTIEYVYKKNQDNQVVNDDIIQINIYIPNIRKKWYNLEKRRKENKIINKEEELTELEKFLLSLAEKNIEFCKKIVEGDIFMQKMVDDVEELCLSQDLLYSYDKEKEYLNIAREDALKEGIEQNKKESAIAMFNKGINKKDIMEILKINDKKLEEYLSEINSQEVA